MEGKTMKQMNPDKKSNKKVLDSAEKGLDKKMGIARKMAKVMGHHTTFIGKK